MLFRSGHRKKGAKCLLERTFDGFSTRLYHKRVCGYEKRTTRRRPQDRRRSPKSPHTSHHDMTHSKHPPSPPTRHQRCSARDWRSSAGAPHMQHVCLSRLGADIWLVTRGSHPGCPHMYTREGEGPRSTGTPCEWQFDFICARIPPPSLRGTG